MRLKQGNKIFLSERGHNGFFYPGKRSLIIIEDVDVKVLSWTGGGEDKIAIAVPANTQVRDWIKTIKIQGPVWINKEDIKKN